MNRPDRRNVRFENPLDALRMFLATIAARLKINSIAVATEDGLLLVGIGSHDLEGLAALGAAAFCDSPLPKELIHGVTKGAQLSTLALEIQGTKLYLASLGKCRVPKSETTSALARILFPKLPTVYDHCEAISA